MNKYLKLMLCASTMSAFCGDVGNQTGISNNNEVNNSNKKDEQKKEKLEGSKFSFTGGASAAYTLFGNECYGIAPFISVFYNGNADYYANGSAGVELQAVSGYEFVTKFRIRGAVIVASSNYATSNIPSLKNVNNQSYFKGGEISLLFELGGFVPYLSIGGFYRYYETNPLLPKQHVFGAVVSLIVPFFVDGFEASVFIQPGYVYPAKIDDPKKVNELKSAYSELISAGCKDDKTKIATDMIEDAVKRFEDEKLRTEFNIINKTENKEEPSSTETNAQNEAETQHGEE